MFQISIVDERLSLLLVENIQAYLLCKYRQLSHRCIRVHERAQTSLENELLIRAHLDPRRQEINEFIIVRNLFPHRLQPRVLLCLGLVTRKRRLLLVREHHLVQKLVAPESKEHE